MQKSSPRAPGPRAPGPGTPRLLQIYVDTDKTTLRVIRRIGGGGKGPHWIDIGLTLDFQGCIAKNSKEKQGKARKSQEKQGKAKKSKEKQGEARKSKEKQGKARKSKEKSIFPCKTQGKTSKEHFPL